MTLFRRSSAVTCFYCLSLIDPHAPSSSHTRAFDPRSFRCLYCGCWNRYDSRGQIIGDEPAMHDELLNTESFSKRGIPDRNQLPSVTSQRSSSPFCRTCQTNQTLLINLRAAYLPDHDDPSYSTRMAQLPAYVASLQTRYPPVCASCLPGVEAEIARKDEYARTRALGGALKASTRPSSRAGGSGTAVKFSRAKLRTWKVRGVLWAASYFVAMITNVAGITQLRIPSFFLSFLSVLPFLVVISLVWTFWDPTFSLQQKSRTQGKQVRVGGRQRYIFLQGLAWISRLSTSSLIAYSGITPAWDVLHSREATPSNIFSIKRLYFEVALALELSVLVLSYFAITIHKPAPVRLIDTSAHRALSELSNVSKNITARSSARGNSVQPEPDFFATLSLSGNPVMGPESVNPMFGQPSLAPGQASHTNGILDDDDEDEDDDVLRRTRPRDPDAMDWEPSFPANQASPRRKSRDDGTWLRQQRFFPPEEPTGLENLLMRARLVDEEEAARQRQRQQQQQEERELHATPRRWSWGWVYSASILPVVAVLAGLWLRSRS